MKQTEQVTHIPESCINPPSHLRHPPFDDITEVLEVKIEVLAGDRALCAILELVLPCPNPDISHWRLYRVRYAHLYQAVLLQHGHDLVDLFGIKPKTAGELLVLDAEDARIQRESE